MDRVCNPVCVDETDRRTPSEEGLCGTFQISTFRRKACRTVGKRLVNSALWTLNCASERTKDYFDNLDIFHAAYTWVHGYGKTYSVTSPPTLCGALAYKDAMSDGAHI